MIRPGIFGGSSHASTCSQLIANGDWRDTSLLVMYNVIFVLPPIALLVGHLVLQKRLAEPYAALGQRLESGARETMLWIAGLVGGGLFVTGTLELMARLR